MDLKYRKIIARIKPIHILARYYMHNKNYFYFTKVDKSNFYSEKLRSLKNRAKGKRCFLIGNGPSLKPDDLEKIKNIDCFSSNEIYRIFPMTNWRPLFLMIGDRYSKTDAKTIDNLDVKNIILSDYYLRYHDVTRKDILCYHGHYPIKQNKIPFSADISKKIYLGSSVSYGLMQLIAYMGYSEVYLLGFDHNYQNEVSKGGKVVKNGEINSHFFKDEKPSDIIANVNGMGKAYQAFKNYADTNGITVKNATRGGHLEVFERIDFDLLLNNLKTNTY